MKKFYIGKVENLIVEIKRNDNNQCEVTTKIITVNDNELFYKNRFNKIIRFKDECPLPSYKEIEDFMNDYLEGKKKSGIYNSGAYYDEKSLNPVEITKENVKKLRLERKKR